MARTDNLTDFLTDVATAIKSKKGDTSPILASNFDEEIRNLPTGGGGEGFENSYTLTSNIETSIEEGFQFEFEALVIPNGTRELQCTVDDTFTSSVTVDVPIDESEYVILKGIFKNDSLDIGEHTIVVSSNSRSFYVTKGELSELYTFGDGSLNKVLWGYSNKLKVNGEFIPVEYRPTYYNNSTNIDSLTTIGTIFKENKYGYTSLSQPLFGSSGNLGKSMINDDETCYQAYFKVNSDTSDYLLCTVPKRDKYTTVYMQFQGGNLMSSWSLKDLKFLTDKAPTTYYSLAELIEHNIIMPLVVLYSASSSGNYYFGNWLNIMDGATNTGSYPAGTIIFTLAPNVEIKSVRLYASKYTGGAPDGLYFCWYDFDLFNIQYRE